MNQLNELQLKDARVAAARVAPSAYCDEDEMRRGVERVGEMMNWNESGRGAFGSVVTKGARVLLKPNLVLHENQGDYGTEPLFTHPSVTRACTEEVLKAEPSEVVVGDAPIQSCNLELLLQQTGLDAWAQKLKQTNPTFKGIRDFRRTTCVLVNGVRVSVENLQDESKFVLFDLQEESLLEEISKDDTAFRVAWYDHRLMQKTHGRGRHQYLVAREILDADVVINLPKLKTHKKAGVTCALKNLIGINGNKEYLPHHRLGGSETGGDGYPGASQVKRALEFVHDKQNVTNSYAKGVLWHGFTFVLARVSRARGDKVGIDGSWSGNDTIWRTCLDLNRILLYGRADGTVADEVQRRVIHLVDAVISGQGEGPLNAMPLEMGLLLASNNAAAMDWVGAWLLGYDPTRIPITREAFKNFRWHIAPFAESSITLHGDLGEGNANEVLRSFSLNPVVYPVGWRDAVRNGASYSAEAHAAHQERTERQESA
ncbi:MAG: DUF362 domain-containing protein [Pyrinomonadaceae bacterium MAG19_C2-C3]|nr:DUF362 domain-containing protein [Pyrinomonadaceae bacterium MAG19_C2-C3]